MHFLFSVVFSAVEPIKLRRKEGKLKTEVIQRLLTIETTILGMEGAGEPTTFQIIYGNKTQCQMFLDKIFRDKSRLSVFEMILDI